MQSVFRDGIFSDRVAIVTGGGSGIGYEIAKVIGALGARVAICGRNAEKLHVAKEALRESGIDVHASVCDIRDYERVEKYCDEVHAALGSVDILVNNAGGQFPTTAETLSPRGWEAVIRNNLNGTFFMTQVAAKKFLIPNRRGKIVNIIANIARGFPGMVHTGAARAGVDNLTKTLAIEWAQYDIQVNAIAPGIIATSGIDQYPQEFVELCRNRTPAKRFGTAHEVAQLAAYLASGAASFVTGETWYIDGGAHLWGDAWAIGDPVR